jgi:hypothetical protein
MATDPINLEFEAKQNKPLKQPVPEPPLTLMLHQAKIRMIGATQEVMHEYSLPAAMMEGIISGILADIRAQASTDLLLDFKKQMIERERNLNQKEGEKLE